MSQEFMGNDNYMESQNTETNIPQEQLSGPFEEDAGKTVMFDAGQFSVPELDAGKTVMFDAGQIPAPEFDSDKTVMFDAGQIPVPEVDSDKTVMFEANATILPEQMGTQNAAAPLGQGQPAQGMPGQFGQNPQAPYQQGMPMQGVPGQFGQNPQAPYQQGMPMQGGPQQFGQNPQAPYQQGMPMQGMPQGGPQQFGQNPQAPYQQGQPMQGMPQGGPLQFGQNPQAPFQQGMPQGMPGQFGQNPQMPYQQGMPGQYGQPAKKKKTGLILGIIGGVVAVVGLVFGISIYKNPDRNLAVHLTNANHFLNDMNYDQARAEYDEALMLDPTNFAALQGIMEVAGATDDAELMQNSIDSMWAAVQMDADFAAEHKEEILEMTFAAESFYSSEEYIALLENLWANEKDDRIKSRLVDLYIVQSNQAWKQGDYENSLDYLKKAYELDPGSKDVLVGMERVVKDYVTDLKNNQRYDEAQELLDWYEGINPDNNVSYLTEEVASMESVNNELQSLIETLNSMFDADDIEGIRSFMESSEWNSNASKIHKTLYSENLLANGNIPNGHGTGLYLIDGTLYVYYGDYVDGKREGFGLWYFIGGRDKLTKYSVNWVNDIPEGRGQVDEYSVMTTRGIGGGVVSESEIHSSKTFNCVHGIFDGEAVESNYDYGDGTSYQLVYYYVNGYLVPVDYYPSEIDQYQPYHQEIASWTEGAYGNKIWVNMSYYLHMIPGCSGTTSNSYAVQDDLYFY